MAGISGETGYLEARPAVEALPRAIGAITLFVEDLPASKRFYQEKTMPPPTSSSTTP